MSKNDKTLSVAEIDKKKATTAPLEQLKAILADDDLRKKDKAYIEKLFKKSNTLDQKDLETAVLERRFIEDDNKRERLETALRINNKGKSAVKTTIPLNPYAPNNEANCSVTS